MDPALSRPGNQTLPEQKAAPPPAVKHKKLDWRKAPLPPTTKLVHKRWSSKRYMWEDGCYYIDSEQVEQRRVSARLARGHQDREERLRVFLFGPYEPHEVVNANRRWVPNGTEFRFYSYGEAQDAVRWISRHLQTYGVQGAYAAYLNLRPMAFRADLFRYMVLWEYGGVYLDAKLTLSAKVGIWATGDRPVFFADTVPGNLWNGALYSPAGHPQMLHIIKKVVWNVKNHFMGSLLGITGPAAISDALGDERCAVGQNEQPTDAGLTVWLDNQKKHQRFTKWVIIPDRQVHLSQETCEICNDYRDLWASGSVYCDTPMNLRKQEYDPCKKAPPMSANVSGPPILVAWREPLSEPSYWSRVIID